MVIATYRLCPGSPGWEHTAGDDGSPNESTVLLGGLVANNKPTPAKPRDSDASYPGLYSVGVAPHVGTESWPKRVLRLVSCLPCGGVSVRPWWDDTNRAVVACGVAMY